MSTRSWFLMLLGLWPAVPDRAVGGDVSFLRGDVNADGRISISDPVMLGRWSQSGELPPPCLVAADANDDGSVNIADIAMCMSALFPRYSQHAPYPPPPFPVPGPDPTPDIGLSCGSYQVEPASKTEDLIRIGDVEASPGGAVAVPVYLTSSMGVEAIQLVVRYDPAIFAVESGLDFAATAWARPAPEFASVTVLDGGIFVVGAVGNLTGRPGVPTGPIPPGNDTLVFKFRGRVSPGAPPGATVLFEPTNGPDGEGVRPPFGIQNEITRKVKTGYASLLPETRPGRLSVIEGDPPPEDPPEDPPPEDPPPATPSFVRGDVNSDGRVSISDALMFRRFRFNGELPPPCLDAADLDDSGAMDLADEVMLLHALFSDGPPLLPPFPRPGPDPTPDAISCGSYEPRPAARTEDLIRIGDVTAGPGEPVEVPVYLTSSVEVDAIQLAVRYDPSVFAPTLAGTRNEVDLDLEGTPWDALRVEFHSLSVLKGEGIFTLGVVGSLTGQRFADDPDPFPPIPPGKDLLVFKIPGRVAAGVPVGTEVLLEPTNGPDGQGVDPPYFLQNEIAHKGEARYVSILPRTEPGVLKIIGDVTFFTRGDANSDGGLDIADASFILEYLFLGGAEPRCPDAADADDSGRLDLTDPVVVLGHLFLGSGALAPPYPGPGPDGTSDTLAPCRMGDAR